MIVTGDEAFVRRPAVSGMGSDPLPCSLDPWLCHGLRMIWNIVTGFPEIIELTCQAPLSLLKLAVCQVCSDVLLEWRV